jgi:pyruvate/2-oxoglutarate dehydrogenase complex dihydrolipoamide dehydrogenase (E3) component
MIGAMTVERVDLVIVGLGSGGMTAAEFAASLGLRVVVVERGRPGGDCLWTGCVPSKALLASAKVAHTVRTAGRFGIAGGEPQVDLPAVWARIRAIQERIAASDDSAEHFEALGARLVTGTASLAGTDLVAVDGIPRFRAKAIVLCTGSRPALPDVDGLDEAGALTSESVFELTDPPRSIVFVGGGPIAVELAQACARLAITTTVLQRGAGILDREEPALAATLRGVLEAEGVALHVGADVERVTRGADGTVTVHASVKGAEPLAVTAAAVLVAAGRRPNVEGLGLEAFGIEVGPKGIVVDDRGRTAVRSVYAAGDVAGRYLFTHSAAYEAVRAVRDAFFPGAGTVDELVPWCTFTDPELAHAGLTSAEARELHGEDDVEVHRLDLTHNDRARTEGHDEGAVMLVTHKGRLIGAHVLAPAAGEVIQELALAIRQEMKLKDLASLIHVYPTIATAVGQLAAEAAYAGAQRYRWLLRT